MRALLNTALPPREPIPSEKSHEVACQPLPRPLRPRPLTLAALIARPAAMNNTMIPREMQDDQDLAFMDQAVVMVRSHRFIS